MEVQNYFIHTGLEQHDGEQMMTEILIDSSCYDVKGFTACTFF